jgi:hypothetical protein
VQIDVRLDEVVLRALEKKPELRYQQVSEVKTLVETIVATPPGITPREEAYSEKPDMVSRFSRTAIAGACWTGFFVVVYAAVIIHLKFFLHGSLTPLESLEIEIIPFFSLLGLTAPFGTTIFGWVAVSQIRHSAGKLRGIWLAMFDGLLFPLVALDAVIFGLVYFIVCLLAKWPYFASLGSGGFGGSFALGYQIAWVSFLFLGGGTLISVVADIFIIRCVWRAVNKPVAAPALRVRKPDRFWRWFAVTVLAMIAIPFLISIVGLLAAIAIPNFIRARQHAIALHEQQVAAKSDYIGQTNFPHGDSIEITSVERTGTQMVVKGHYNLVSADNAELALYITTTNNASMPTDPKQEMQISKGRGDFDLVDSHLVLGWPHVNMYPVAGGGPFAELYFGTKVEAAEECKLDLSDHPSLTFGPVIERVVTSPPFMARLKQGSVELVAIGNQPWSNTVCWLPNGTLSSQPFPNRDFGSMEAWAKNMDMEKIAFRIHDESSNGPISRPVCRVNQESGVLAQGSSVVQPSGPRSPDTTYVTLIARPTNAMTMNVSLGVANGAWEIATTLEHKNNAFGSAIAEGEWSASYNAVVGGGSDIAVNCNYNKSENWDTRMVCVADDARPR